MNNYSVTVYNYDELPPEIKEEWACESNTDRSYDCYLFIKIGEKVVRVESGRVIHVDR